MIDRTDPDRRMSGEELKLLPCPFCGASPDVHDSNMGWQYVICPHCNSAAGDHANRDAAVKAWNTRHPLPEQPREGVTISRDLYDFLLGQAEFDGTWFGDSHDMMRGKFWWRTILRSFDPTETKESGDA